MNKVFNQIIENNILCLEADEEDEGIRSNI
jgi:hypothetical protein